MPTPPRPKGPKGRPRLDPNDESVSVHFRLPTKEYDDVWQRAQDHRMGVGDYIRLRLRDDLPPGKP